MANLYMGKAWFWEELTVSMVEATTRNRRSQGGRVSVGTATRVGQFVRGYIHRVNTIYALWGNYAAIICVLFILGRYQSWMGIVAFDQKFSEVLLPSKSNNTSVYLMPY